MIGILELVGLALVLDAGAEGVGFAGDAVVGVGAVGGVEGEGRAGDGDQGVADFSCGDDEVVDGVVGGEGGELSDVGIDDKGGVGAEVFDVDVVGFDVEVVVEVDLVGVADHDGLCVEASEVARFAGEVEGDVFGGVVFVVEVAVLGDGHGGCSCRRRRRAKRGCRCRRRCCR